MEKQMTKAKFLLTKAVAACGDNESVLVIYSGAADGNVAMCGDPNEIAVGVAHIMANGVRENPSFNESKLANSILNGIYKVLAKGDKNAIYLSKALQNVTERAENVINKKKRNSGHSAPEEFNPRSKDCLSCDGFEDCMKRYARDLIINDVQRVFGGKSNNNIKKTKKVRNHGNNK